MFAKPMTPFETGILRLVREHDEKYTARQIAVLILTAHKSDATVRGVAEELGLKKPTITRAADRLEEDGLLVRKDDEEDRRSVLIVATSQGQKFLAKLGKD